MSREPSAGQKWGLFGVSLLVVLLSVGSTLYMSGIPAGFWGDDGPEPETRYKHITLTDAEMACTAEARAVFGQRLKHLRVDRFSSRLDKADELFKVFMEADIYPNESREGVARDTFINCFTAIGAPEIKLFQYAKDGEQFIAPGEEEKGMFGL